MSPPTDLLTPLRRYWGYDSFRPLQERVVRSLLAGRDTCVVMPTGGGKSLCYQLPAVISERTTVVVSPLIALMQDQAAQLAQMGIPAAVLNSFLSHEQQSKSYARPATAHTGCSIFPPSASPAPILWGGCSKCPSHFLSLMKPTAFPSGGTNSAPNTGI